MKIVAVAACKSGIAHAYLAAEQLERLGRNLGHSIKIETHGSMGVDSALTGEDIRGADVVIIAADTRIADLERFAAVPAIVEVRIQEAIRSPATVFEKLHQESM